MARDDWVTNATIHTSLATLPDLSRLKQWLPTVDAKFPALDVRSGT